MRQPSYQHRSYSCQVALIQQCWIWVSYIHTCIYGGIKHDRLTISKLIFSSPSSPQPPQQQPHDELSITLHYPSGFNRFPGNPTKQGRSKLLCSTGAGAQMEQQQQHLTFHTWIKYSIIHDLEFTFKRIGPLHKRQADIRAEMHRQMVHFLSNIRMYQLKYSLTVKSDWFFVLWPYLKPEPLRKI